MDTFILPSKSPGLGLATSLSSVSAFESSNVELVGGDDLLAVHIDELLPAHTVQGCCSQVCSCLQSVLQARRDGEIEFWVVAGKEDSEWQRCHQALGAMLALQLLDASCPGPVWQGHRPNAQVPASRKFNG